MLWYLLRTWPGREEMLVKEIQKTVPSYLYQEVFVIYNERIWRRQGESIIHAEPLFPGCVFYVYTAGPGYVSPACFRRAFRISIDGRGYRIPGADHG